MEELDNWIRRLLAPVYVLSLLVLIRSSSAGEGFVSIACCAASNYTDPWTTLNYTSDYNYFPDRTSCRDIKPVANHVGQERARVFDIHEKEKCYSLPTIKDQVYLLRSTFPSDASLSKFPFEVSIGVTLLGPVQPSQDLYIEGIFRATRNNTDFCLVKEEEGNLQISLLELRPSHEEYLQGLPSRVLKLISRNNLGGKVDYIRYPTDQSDRIWEITPIPSSDPLASSSANISDYNAVVNVTAPLQVLRTALTHPERLEFIHNGIETEIYEYRVFLYFLELDDTVRQGQRVFDIYVNSEIIEERVDILADGSNYNYTVLNVSAIGYLNLTLVKATGSQFGPLCNAYEILQVHQWVEETNQADLEVILKVRQELLAQNQGNQALESWTGDPCILYPWQGVRCDRVGGPAFITELDLSSRNLKGPIPTSVTELTNLENLNLSHNDFSGDVPSFPPSSLLISLDVSYNDLTGWLPGSIILLSHLKSLYFGCNSNMSKEVPSNLNSSLDTDRGRCKTKESEIPEEIIIGIVASGLLLVTLGAGILFGCRCREKLIPWGGFGEKRYPMTRNVIFSLSSKDDFSKSVSIQTFTLEDIEVATEKYKTLIGEGGFGSVYRGTLADGQEVAVKVRSATSTQGTREFENELNLLTAIRHENLVPLLGYCSENDQQILVYPFMSNGSLQDRLYGEPAKRKVLDWPTRISIALGAARGLSYLHTFPGRSVIHRDVKSSNILLDHSMCAKVADFGFSKYAPQEGDSNASLEVRGTAGYLDPEYYTTQHLSAKSDVFSFGVVLLEIVSGREPLDIRRPRNEWSLVEWAKLYFRAGRIDEIVDPGIKGAYHTEAMWRAVEIALSCVEPFSANRPSMSDIIRELEDALIIENNASEYMKSIDSLGGSARYSIVIEKRALPATPTTTESTITTQTLSLPQPR